jgi:hypothetical protein
MGNCTERMAKNGKKVTNLKLVWGVSQGVSEAELYSICTRFGKRVDEFEDEWNDRYRPTSPASCGTTCRGCESHIRGDCATEDRVAREEESETVHHYTMARLPSHQIMLRDSSSPKSSG